MNIKAVLQIKNVVIVYGNETPYRFFKLIGFEPPLEIKNCLTGRKEIYKEEKFFEDKWPNRDDWIKILSNVKIGSVLKEKRLQLEISQNKLSRLVGMRRETIRDVELCKRNYSVENLRKIMNILDINTSDLITKILI